MNTIILNQLETELKEVKRKKRNVLNFHDFSNYEYYEDKISELNNKIKEIKKSQTIKTQVNEKEVKINKVYYKDINLSKRDFDIINNKKIYKPLYIYIQEKDILAMLEDMYKFYSKRRYEIYNLYNENRILLSEDKEYNQICDRKQEVGRLKSWVKLGTYKNFIIKFDKDERPSREDYIKILYYLNVDGYIPHIDILEII